MNVLIICPPYKPIPAVEGGAIENLVDDYLKYNSKRNTFQVTIYSIYSENVKNEIIEDYQNTIFRYIKKNTIKYKINRLLTGIRKRVYPKAQIPMPYGLCVVSDLKKKKELEKYDLVIIENQIESLIYYGNIFKGRIVEHIHNDYINVNTKDAWNVVKSCKEFWCVSNFIANQIKGINNDARTKVLYNGVDYNKFNVRIDNKEKENIYNKIGFNKDNYIVLYVGRLMPEKGVLQLVKAFNNIKKKDDNLKLLIVGDKKSNSVSIQNYYNLLLKEKEKNEDSIYIYGNANIEELRILYSISSAQVVPSIWEEAFRTHCC